MAQSLTTKDLFSRDDVKAKFTELLGKRAASFMTSVLQTIAANDALKDADPNSVYHAAATAATLDLPINNNLGFAYIIPFKDAKQGGKTFAQFQIGYRGFIQLAQRSGQFRTISYAEIYEGQLIGEDPLAGFKFDFTKKKSDKVIGYAAYFELLNGFQKTLYWSIDQVEKHGKKFSQTYKRGFGLWKDDFDSMAKKTVLKILLSKFAPLSIEMQRAVIVDQSVIQDPNADSVEYVDAEEQESKEISAPPLNIADILIDSCKTWEELEEIKINNADDKELCAKAELKQKEMEGKK